MKHSEKIAPVAAAVSALATLACCLPVGFAAAAATASIGAFVAPLRSWFLGASIVLLAIGTVQVTRGQRKCAARARALSVILLSISALIVVMVTLFPQVVASLMADWMS